LENAAFQFNWIGELFDTIFKLLGKYGTWLGIKKNRYGFLIHTACCLYWVGINIHRSLWAQAIFTIPTIAMQIYGFYKWGQEERENAK